MASHYINPQDIWNLFYDIYGGNEYACAGAMGNMQAESGLYSDNAENSWNSLTGKTDEWLTQEINTGQIDLNTFLQRSWYVNRYGFGYGLSQWTDSARRTKLWNFTIDQGLDIDSQVGQFNYIRWEWLDSSSHYHQYLNYMMNCTTVLQATRYYCEHYEVGAWNQSRYTYAQNWYNTFAGSHGSGNPITVVVSGNGTGYTVPTHGEYLDPIAVYFTAGSGDTCTDLEVRETVSGMSIATNLDPSLKL